MPINTKKKSFVRIYRLWKLKYAQKRQEIWYSKEVHVILIVFSNTTPLPLRIGRRSKLTKFEAIGIGWFISRKPSVSSWSKTVVLWFHLSIARRIPSPPPPFPTDIVEIFIELDASTSEKTSCKLETLKFHFYRQIILVLNFLSDIILLQY